MSKQKEQTMEQKRASIINTTKNLFIISFLSLATVIVSFQIFIHYQEFNTQIKNIRSKHITERKIMIKQEVSRIIERIKYEKKINKLQARKNSKQKVHSACTIANNIYKENKNSKTTAKIQEIIINTLKNMSSTQKTGYYFIFSLDGKEILLGNKPKLKRRNILDIKDFNGKCVVKDMIRKVKQQNEGFCEYYWTKPNATGNKHKKISFIKRFEPYNWLIGFGFYTEDIDSLSKKLIQERISQAKYGKNGYFFVDDSNGISIARGKQQELIGKSMLENEDSRGNKTTKLLRAVAKNKDGGYVRYWWIKPDTKKEAPKIGYAKIIPDWKWMIGTGIYIDDVESEVNTLRLELKEHFKKYIVTTILITTIIFLLFWLIFRRISRNLLNDFSIFTKFFNSTKHGKKGIDTNKIKYEELYLMAKEANTMLHDKIVAQHNLLDEKEQLAVTLRSIGDGVITTNTDGKIVLMNRIAEILTGWQETDAINKPLSDIFNIIDKDSKESVESSIEKVLETGDTINIIRHFTLISKNKTKYDIDSSIAPIRDSDSNIRGAVVVFRDISEKLKIEQEHLKLRKLESVGVLAGGIAHDFNNLLTSIFGNVEMAKMFLPDDDNSNKVNKYLDQAMHFMDDAISLTKQLLVFSKGGKAIKKIIPIGEDLVTTAQFSLRGSTVKLKTDIASDLWMVEADKGQLNQVFSNLVINAQQAMPNGGIITITAKNIEDQKNKYIQINIQDEGTGIKPEYLDKIFDPYFSTKQQGSGLGLASTYSIINNHKGTIMVDSILDVGTNFTIILPAKEPYEKSTVVTSPNISDIPVTSTLHILVMDDQESIRVLAKEMLKKCGYSSETVADGKEALEKYVSAQKSGNPFDVVIMDLTIPGGMGGKEAVSKLLNIDRKAKVIVSSGYSSDNIMANYKNYGFKGRISKPFLAESLKKEISKVMKL